MRILFEEPTWIVVLLFLTFNYFLLRIKSKFFTWYNIFPWLCFLGMLFLWLGITLEFFLRIIAIVNVLSWLLLLISSFIYIDLFRCMWNWGVNLLIILSIQRAQSTSLKRAISLVTSLPSWRIILELRFICLSSIFFPKTILN